MKEDAFASQQTLSIKSTSTSRSTGIMRHVSNLLSGNKKSSQKLSNSSPTSSVFKIPGSLTSRPSKSSLVSTSYSPSVDYGKSSSNSHANILPSELPSISTRRVVPAATATRVAVVGPLPQDIVTIIVSHTPRRSLPSIARTSRAFCKAARVALYSNIDVRFIRSARFEQLCILLASHTDLANLVEKFTYHTWHPSFFQRAGKSVSRARDTRISLSSSATATLASALKNMQNLQHLTLPSFNASLMQDVLSPVLKKLTLFNHSLSPEEQHELKVWLRTQPGLQSLSLPNLFEKQINADSTLSPSSPSPSAPATPELSPPSTPPLVSFSGNPSSLRSQRLHTLSPTLTSPSILSTISEQSGAFLPLLHSIHAPPNFVTFILSDQTALPTPPPSSHSLSVDIPRGSSSQSSHTIPLKHTTLRIHSTLYTGLRPLSLMQSLASRGTSVLTLCFSSDMDKRTVEKVLGAAGSMLGQIQTKRKRLAALEILEVEVSNAGVWCDDDVSTYSILYCCDLYAARVVVGINPSKRLIDNHSLTGAQQNRIIDYLPFSLVAYAPPSLHPIQESSSRVVLIIISRQQHRLTTVINPFNEYYHITSYHQLRVSFRLYPR